MRGPLEVLRDNLLEGDTSEHSFVEWVEQLRFNLFDFGILACDRTALAKHRMKYHYDKFTLPSIEFPLGSMGPLAYFPSLIMLGRDHLKSFGKLLGKFLCLTT